MRHPKLERAVRAVHAQGERLFQANTFGANSTHFLQLMDKMRGRNITPKGGGWLACYELPDVLPEPETPAHDHRVPLMAPRRVYSLKDKLRAIERKRTA